MSYAASLTRLTESCLTDSTTASSNSETGTSTSLWPAPIVTLAGREARLTSFSPLPA